MLQELSQGWKNALFALYHLGIKDKSYKMSALTLDKKGRHQ